MHFDRLCCSDCVATVRGWSRDWAMCFVVYCFLYVKDGQDNTRIATLRTIEIGEMV